MSITAQGSNYVNLMDLAPALQYMSMETISRLLSKNRLGLTPFSLLEWGSDIILYTIDIERRVLITHRGVMDAVCGILAVQHVKIVDDTVTAEPSPPPSRSRIEIQYNQTTLRARIASQYANLTVLGYSPAEFEELVRTKMALVGDEIELAKLSVLENVLKVEESQHVGCSAESTGANIVAPDTT